MAYDGANEYRVCLDALCTGDPKALTPQSVAAVTRYLSEAGLASQVQSWIGKTPNMPVTPAQITKAFGAEQIAGIAKKWDTTPETVAEHLSARLPLVIDAITPEGKGKDHNDFAPGVRGLIDGSSNYANVLDSSTALGVMANSKVNARSTGQSQNNPKMK